MAVEVVRPSEVQAVTVWRLDQLKKGGYPLNLAAELAEDDRVDLHLALDLLEQGCPLGTALRILAPIEGER